MLSYASCFKEPLTLRTLHKLGPRDNSVVSYNTLHRDQHTYNARHEHNFMRELDAQHLTLLEKNKDWPLNRSIYTLQVSIHLKAEI